MVLWNLRARNPILIYFSCCVLQLRNCPRTKVATRANRDSLECDWTNPASSRKEAAASSLYLPAFQWHVRAWHSLPLLSCCTLCAMLLWAPCGSPQTGPPSASWTWCNVCPWTDGSNNCAGPFSVWFLGNRVTTIGIQHQAYNYYPYVLQSRTCTLSVWTALSPFVSHCLSSVLSSASFITVSTLTTPASSREYKR